jgi:hypothetical protein
LVDLNRPSIDRTDEESAMRLLMLASCFAFFMSFMLAAPVQAKGGRRGRTTFGGSGERADQGDGRSNDQGEDDDDRGSRRPVSVAQRPTPAATTAHSNPVATNTAANNSPANLHSVLKRSPAANNQQQQLLAEQKRDRMLADAQNVREIAQRNGNPNLLADADRMEAEALEQYADRVAQLEKLGLTKPALASTTPAPLVLPPPPVQPVPTQPLLPRRPVDVILDAFDFLPFGP